MVSQINYLQALSSKSTITFESVKSLDLETYTLDIYIMDINSALILTGVDREFLM